MNFDNVYQDYIKNEEPNDTAIAEDFKKFCRSQKYIKPHYGSLSSYFESEIEAALESRKSLSSDGEDLLRDIILYCVVKAFNLNPDYADIYLDTSMAGYMFHFYSEYDNIKGTLGISVNPIAITFMDGNNKDVDIKELEIEDLITYGFETKLMKIVMDAIRNKAVYTSRMTDDYSSPMEYAIDNAGSRYSNDQNRKEIYEHWVELGLIDHVPTEEEIANNK